MASQWGDDMRQLRVLTGAHAGVQLTLGEGNWRIGAHEPVDICLDDWDDAPMVIEVRPADAGALVTWRRSEAAQQRAWPDLQALRFGDVVLCIGPSSKPWPSDMALLQSVMQPSLADGRARRARRWPKGWLALSLSVRPPTSALPQPARVTMPRSRQLPSSKRRVR